MAYVLRWEGHGVYRRFHGEVTSVEFRDAYFEMTGDLRYEGTRYIISDYLDATPGQGLTETFVGRIEQLTRLQYDCGPDIVHATVARGEKILSHVCCFESMPMAPFPEATFTTVDEARRWVAGNPRPAWRVRPTANANI